MVPDTVQPRRGAFSYLILTGCFALLAGCEGAKDTPPAGEPGATPTPQAAAGEWTPETATEARTPVDLSEDAFRGAGTVLPRESELSGWTYLEPPFYYSETNLFDLIDGGGASFVEIGFVEAAYGLLQMDEAPPEIGREVGLEIYIYQMTTPDAASTKYAIDHETGDCRTVTGITVAHCKTSSSLDLLSGPYYVRLQLDSDHPVLQGPLDNAGRTVARYVGGDDTAPSGSERPTEGTPAPSEPSDSSAPAPANQ